jgi:hypothetical protein
LQSISIRSQEYDDAESEEGAELDIGEEVSSSKGRKTDCHHRLEEFSCRPILRLSPMKRRQGPSASITKPSTLAPVMVGKVESEDDMDLDADAEGESYIEEPSSPNAVSSTPVARVLSKRPLQRGLVDLDSVQGRYVLSLAS